MLILLHMNAAAIAEKFEAKNAHPSRTTQGTFHLLQHNTQMGVLPVLIFPMRFKAPVS